MEAAAHLHQGLKLVLSRCDKRTRFHVYHRISPARVRHEIHNIPGRLQLLEGSVQLIVCAPVNNKRAHGWLVRTELLLQPRGRCNLSASRLWRQSSYSLCSLNYASCFRLMKSAQPFLLQVLAASPTKRVSGKPYSLKL